MTSEITTLLSICIGYILPFSLLPFLIACPLHHIAIIYPLEHRGLSHLALALHQKPSCLAIQPLLSTFFFHIVPLPSLAISFIHLTISCPFIFTLKSVCPWSDIWCLIQKQILHQYFVSPWALMTSEISIHFCQYAMDNYLQNRLFLNCIANSQQNPWKGYILKINLFTSI